MMRSMVVPLDGSAMAEFALLPAAELGPPGGRDGLARAGPGRPGTSARSLRRGFSGRSGVTMRTSVERALAVVATLVIALAGGCGIQAPAGPVPVEGARGALDSLSGDWEGTYRASGASRHGIINFSLRPGADTAHGEVEITFAPTLRLYGDPPDEALPRAPCLVLDIALVRMDAGTVRGTVAPHWDPDCECQTSAVFEGRLSGPDKVEGTFTSRRAPDGPVVLSGRWVAERR